MSSELVPASPPGNIPIPTEPPKISLTAKERASIDKEETISILAMSKMKAAAQVGEKLEQMGAIKVGAGYVMIANEKIAPLLDMSVELAMDDSLNPESRIAAGSLARSIHDTYVRGAKVLSDIVASKQINNNPTDGRRPGPPPPSQVVIKADNLTINEAEQKK